MSHDLELSQFIELTNTSQEIAIQYLSNAGYDVEQALADYFANPTGAQEANSQQQQQQPATPTPTTVKKAKPSKPLFRTFRDLSKPESDSEDDSEKNLFTGGEKSGLEVENPENAAKKNRNPLGLVEDLIKKAQEEAAQPDTRPSAKEAAKPKKSLFTGTGHKLGSVDNQVESTSIESKKPSGFQAPEKVTRTITFWKEGFQVEDGELYRYDDAKNAEYLKQLNQGRAPLSLLNVKMFQDVDVTVIKKIDESFVPPKRKIGGFLGAGHRLGSPVPFEDSPELPVAGASSSTDAPVETKQEESKKEEGGSRIQIRLANGQRLVKSFNSADPVSEVYQFVSENTEVNGREWSLAFAFPLKVIDDLKEKTVKEAGLVNAVIVQRWK